MFEKELELDADFRRGEIDSHFWGQVSSFSRVLVGLV